jgi:exodeoxyribonuclease-3
MRLVSWNVNGIRACAGKGFVESMLALDADVICLQEVKAKEEQVPVSLPGYDLIVHSADKPGYSGTAVFSRVPHGAPVFGMGIEQHDREGRLITLDMGDFILVNCYTPNAQRGLTRLEYRMQWEDDFRAYLRALDDVKPVVLCGDLNVAHQEIDIKNAKANRGNAGFTDEEREKFTLLLQSGFVDSFRHLYPDRKDAYTWWSYFGNARASNTGWRIDYFVVSRKLKDRILGAEIHPDIMGSDHCPVELTI